MNHLHQALMSPDLNSLCLFDTHIEAQAAFHGYLNEAMRFGTVVAKHTTLEYVFSDGGRLRFGYMRDEMDVDWYRGSEWANVFVNRLDRQYREFAMAILFKPVYKERGNGV